MTTVAVIGCTHAGTFAAQSIIQAHPDWQVHVFERNDTLSFLSCGIALWIGDNVSDPKKMFYSSPEALSQVGAHMHMKHEVLSVSVADHKLEAKDLQTGEETTYTFDKLVVTTGSRPVIPPIAGVDGPHVKLCKNWGHAAELKELVSKTSSVVVIGSGYIGAELAEQYSTIGVKVTLVDALDRALANNFDQFITDEVEEKFTEHGVTLALGQKVLEIKDREDGVTVVTEKGEYDADLAILAAGFQPSTDLLKDQLDMLDNGAIIVDEYMHTSHEDVFAAGDAAAVFYNPTQSYDYIPLATNAVRQALLVGANIETPTRKYMGTQATSAVQLYDLSLAATGLTQGGAERRGLKTKSTTLVDNYRPEFMLTTTPVRCVLTFDEETRQILGAQFSSKTDISNAANVVSLAIQAKFTVEDLANVDFLFQPNFDKPVNYIAAVAMKATAE